MPRQSLDASISATLERASLLEAPTKWELNPEEIEIGKKLGKGAFGTVYKGKLHGKDVAIKKLHMTNLDADAEEDFRAEMTIMRFSSSHIIFNYFLFIFFFFLFFLFFVGV